jgi:hypothetical protein
MRCRTEREEAMKTSAFILAVLVASIGTFACEPAKDETRHAGGYGYSGGDPRARHAREFKEDYRQGGCKVERTGEYKEEVKCKGLRW